MTSPAPGPMQLPATWSAVAAGYAKDLVHFTAYAEEALRILPLSLPQRILDVASGPGTLTFVAAPHVSEVTAVDFSEGMLSELQARAEREGVSNVRTQVMDARALSFEASSFDAAFCLFAFMFFPDRSQVFNELFRVLRPGGRALFSTWSPIDRRPLMKVGFDSLAEALPDLPPAPKGDLQQPEECIREMSAAGFVDVEASTFTAAWSIESAEAYLAFMERSGAPFAALKKKLGEAAWSEASGRLVAALRRRIPEGGASLSAEAILTVGTRPRA